MSRSTTSPKGDEIKSNHTGGPSSRHFAIYDVKGTKAQMRNIFDACERGDHKAVMSYAKEKNFDVEAKVYRHDSTQKCPLSNHKN